MVIQESVSGVSLAPHRPERMVFEPTDRPSREQERIADRIFRDRLSQAVAQAERTGETVALHVLVVETPMGATRPLESFLLETARRIDALVRDCDATTYLGEGRFAVLQRAIYNDLGVEVLARKLLAAVCTPLSCGGQEVSLDAAIGFGLHTSGVDATELLYRAEYSVLEARTKGQSCYRAETEIPYRSLPQNDDSIG